MTRAGRWLWVCALVVPAALDADPPPRAAGSRVPARVAAHLAARGPTPQLADTAPYVEGQYLVAPPPDTSLDAIARRLGAEVIAPVGRSGYGVVRTQHPERWPDVAPLGRIVGTGKKVTTASTTTSSKPAPVVVPPTWHLSAIGAPTTAAGSPSFADWRVAVLDTGVAYETYGPFVRAPGLAGVAFEDPLDLVEGDQHPDDDHQHGTHITSLIASQGLIPGVAPGATIVPVKVLDATNTGTEFALIEGLYHAIDHHVDVINLSVSFPLGYVPSRPLRDALEAAWDAEIVVVAAAGNDGERELSWPAASRLVVSVGGSRSVVTWKEQTDYSNTSPALDILAPGGQLDVDENGDGFVDGVVAETIDPTNPGRTGFWAYQGTSQATALVSGLAVRLLAAGVAPRDVGPAIQQSRGGFDPWDAKLTGTGSDIADLSTALASTAAHEEVYVGVAPYVADLGWAHDPRARVVALDAAGAPLAGVDVIGSMHSAEGVWWPMCTTDAAGACTLRTLDVFGRSDAWAFRVDAVVVDGVARRPARAVFASPGADVLLTALLDAPEAWDAVGVYWPAGADAELGTLAEAWAVVDVGVGGADAPTALLFEPSAVATTALAGTLTLDPDGTGLLSSPVGTLSVRTLTFDGTGLLSSPVGSLRLVGLDGTGLLSSPVGFSALKLYASSTDPAIALDSGTSFGGSLGGTSFEQVFVNGTGSTTTAGYAPTHALVGSGAIEVGLTPAGASSTASTAQAVEWK